MHKSLTIALATRCRAGLVGRTVNETLAHARDPNTKIVLLIDDDDSGAISLRNHELTDPRIIWSIEPRPDSLGTKYNRVLRVSEADVYLVMVDYAPHMVDGFDSKILETANIYSDGYAIILNYLANGSFTQINAVTAKMAKRMGGIYPEYFSFWFIDHWLEEIARRTGRGIFCDVQIDASRKQETINCKDVIFWSGVFDWLRLERIAMTEHILAADDFVAVTSEYKEAMRINSSFGLYVDSWSWAIHNANSTDPETGQPMQWPASVRGQDRAYDRLVDAANAIVLPRIKARDEAAQKKVA